MAGICEKIDEGLLREICELAYEQRENVCKIFIIGSGGVLSWLLFPFVLAAIGFTSAGIAAGSLAAKMMAYFAVANGGGVAAGGLVAFLQSLAAGMGWGATGGTAGAGATLASLLSDICNQNTANDHSWRHGKGFDYACDQSGRCYPSH